MGFIDKKAQAALEYMLIMGIALAILVPLFSVVSSQTYSFKTEMKLSSVEDSLQNLADSSDMVYSQGYPAKITTKLYLPEGTLYTNVTENIFHVRIKKKSGPVDISSFPEANLTGSLPESPGSYQIELKMTEKGVVNVTQS